ncbi:MAG: preprotein translocase subunit YajC [Dysgonamonadaceae bacterium]|jgi:preprotein translocase subunit YajC|nr:preprotein translocase subunit YajC [Dysgonamonadaceae bacterium]
MSLLHILLQAEAPAQGGAMGGYSSLIMIVLLFVVMYFLMIRPQQKKQKEVQKMRAALRVGDRVITSGGIYGKIKDINDTTFNIEITDNVRIKVDKASVFAAADDNQATK